VSKPKPLLWLWEQRLDDDGHPFWKANGYTIWRAGGETGDFLTEQGGIHKTLAAAKAECRKHQENDADRHLLRRG
jgi:hypothetical protein